MKTLLLLAVCALAHAEDASRFEAVCHIEWKGQIFKDLPCSVEDQPGPDVWNRWTITIRWPQERRPQLARARSAEWVRGEATSDGGMINAGLLWGRVTVAPIDAAVRARFSKAWARQSPPAWEVRPQNLEVRDFSDRVELIFDEPRSETDGWDVPSAAWQKRFQDAITIFGGSKK